MQTKHTPGPWIFTKASRPDNTGGFDYAITPAGTSYILAEAFENVGRDDDTKEYIKYPNEANARLIAAAPELLEALKRAVAETIDAFKDDPIGQEYTSGWLSEARAAIGKAKGGAA